MRVCGCLCGAREVCGRPRSSAPAGPWAGPRGVRRYHFDRSVVENRPIFIVGSIEPPGPETRADGFKVAASPKEIYWIRSNSTYVALLDTTSAAALCRTDVTAGSITSNRVARAAAAPTCAVAPASVSSGRETIGWWPRPGLRYCPSPAEPRSNLNPPGMPIPACARSCGRGRVARRQTEGADRHRDRACRNVTNEPKRCKMRLCSRDNDGASNTRSREPLLCAERSNAREQTNVHIRFDSKMARRRRIDRLRGDRAHRRGRGATAGVATGFFFGQCGVADLLCGFFDLFKLTLMACLFSGRAG